MKRLILSMVALSTMFVGCGDLVIKVNKNSKGSSLSAEDAEKAMSLTEGKFFLDDMDDLRTAAVNTLLKHIQGEDFRHLVRDGFRSFHKNLVDEVSRTKNVSTMSLNTEEVACTEGKLNLSVHDMNNYLGLLLKAAVLGKINDFNAKALNKDLASQADAITTLIMKEVGLNVDGETTVENVGGQTVTKAKVVISLVPFDSDVAEVKEADKTRKIVLSFVRKVGDHNVGTFAGRIRAIQSAGEGQTESHVLSINASRVLADGLFEHQTRVAFGKGGEEAHFVRQLTFKEMADQKVKVIDRITSQGKTEMAAEVIDLTKIKNCVMEKIDLSEDDLDSDQKGEDDSQSQDDLDDEDTSGGKDSGSKNDDEDDDEIEEIEGEDDDKLGGDGSPTTQSPVQSK